MSAYIIDDETMDEIISYLANLRGSALDSAIKPFQDAQNTTFLGKSGNLDTWKLGQTLFDMNFDAVNQRYNESTPYQFYGFTQRRPDLQRCIKAVSTLIYQCDEGDVPETSLFKALGRVHYDLLEEFFNLHAQAA